MAASWIPFVYLLTRYPESLNSSKKSFVYFIYSIGPLIFKLHFVKSAHQFTLALALALALTLTLKLTLTLTLALILRLTLRLTDCESLGRILLREKRCDVVAAIEIQVFKIRALNKIDFNSNHIF